MTRRQSFISPLSLVLIGLAGFAPSVFAQDEPLPKAETILDRYVEVTGGKAAYEKRKNIVGYTDGRLFSGEEDHPPESRE